jgi:capsular exopolysaccharide synthesis family protein
MSELFKWLKKTEAQSRGLETAVSSIEVASPQPNQTEEPVAALQVAPKRPFVQSREKFDLELADARLRVVLDHRTMPGEQFRFLRAKLSQLRRQHQLKSLLVTSSVPGEGKTFTACCLAGILAQEPGKRVLLVDADLRKPKASQNLGITDTEKPSGLAQILQGTKCLEETLLSSSSMDFFFLPAGEEPDNPSELLASANLDQTFKRMTELFDWIVVDSTPVLTLADPARLATLCDGVLMVVHANKTSAKMAQKAIQMIGKELVLGVILNRVKHMNPSRYYHHYYSDTGAAKK